MIKICGTGSALPALRVTNDDLSKIMDTSDEWIRSRTGIGARHLAVEETTAGLSVEAAKQALAGAGMEAEELDLIIAATLSPDHVLPTLACEVQAALGAKRAVAFDLHAACSGFLFSLNTAAAYLTSGIYKNALIIGAETLSKMLDWTDRSTCVLFGDGAGAAVVRALPDGADAEGFKSAFGDGIGSENVVSNRNRAGLKSFVQYSDGSRGSVLACGGRPLVHPFTDKKEEGQYVVMDGQGVYKFAVGTVPKVIAEAVEKAGLTIGEIDHFVLHQANSRIIASVAKHLKQPVEKFPMNLQECGNISAASVPILLDSLNKGGKIQKGEQIVLAGFGAGLTWAAAVIGW